MVARNALFFVRLGEEAHDIEVCYSSAEGQDAIPIDGDGWRAIKGHFGKLHKLCEDLKLRVSSGLLRDRIFGHSAFPKTLGEFAILRDAIYTELADRNLLYIPSERIQYFQPSKLISEELATAFPEASKDLSVAAMCYALNLPTAAVFHAMRAVERGVHAMAHSLDVKFDYPMQLADIGKIIGEIEKKIQQFRIGPRTVKKDENIGFYSAAAAQFRHFNSGWRIRSAHSRASYDDRQAKGVVDGVMTFFDVLAQRVSEQCA